MHSSGRSILGRTLVLFLIGFSALCIIVGTATWLFARTTTYTASIVSIREAPGFSRRSWSASRAAWAGKDRR